MQNSDYISLLGVIAGLGVFISGFYQYVKAQKWKRAEFVAKEIKEFEAKPKNQLAMQMLDWNVRRYDINEISDKSGTLITDEILEKALRPHDTENTYSPTEVFIRDVFDKYFDEMERFDHFIQSGLVTPEEFKPYLLYWIEIIGDSENERKPKKCREAIWKYLDFYGYDGVKRLLSRYKYSIDP